MKKIIVLIAFAIISITLPSYFILNKAGKVGFTGSPGENACNNCHNSFALNSGTGSIKIVTDIPNDMYAPGTTYQISVIVAKPGTNLFGFGCEILTEDETNAGTITVTDAVRTQKLNATNGRTNMTHKLNGGAFADSAVFTFNWTSPSTNEGNIKFYFSGVCANGNNSNSLDHVYKGSHTITPSPVFGLEDEPSFSDLKVFPSIDNQRVNISFVLKESADIELNLVALDGKPVAYVNYTQESPGEKQYTIETQGLTSGVYVLQARINRASVSRKFLVVQ